MCIAQLNDPAQRFTSTLTKNTTQLTWEEEFTSDLNSKSNEFYVKTAQGSSQTVTAGISADGYLVNTGQAVDSSDNSERTGEQVSPDTNETNTDTDLFVPKFSSSLLPVTIESTGLLQQNTNSLTTSIGQVHSSDLQGNYIQTTVSQETQAQNIQSRLQMLLRPCT
ncbi:Transcription factor Sp3 [Sciurus carolinensis]|uniref:Transcription factor Sp3 n=1 Tax=Sciurus carolinensis TaxID=30640 RepID=A0AA41SVX2_SCICA|nr:Transcription factor Sp3 [Sciurus carolinensis]